ncbi:uroporphyrinogen-III synthase [Sinomonas soli]
MAPEGAAGPALAGRRVLLTRSPDRAGAMVRALARAGAEPLLLPVIDFERADDPAALASALDGLGAGEYGWLVISSITTVRALKEAAAARGTTLAQLVPGTVRVATIGPSSRRVLEAEGLRVDLAPTGKQSAEGLVELWPRHGDGAGAGAGRVLIPQSNLAAPTLAEGVAAQGWPVETVTAYRTVDYPADPDRRLIAVLAAAASEGGGAAEEAPGVVLTPHEANGELAAGRIDAVVAASPSAARRIHETLRPLDAVQLIAIGEPTAAELRALGLAVGATAATPTPEGIAEAVARSLFR